MKFGKSLSNQIEGALPEWRDKFLSYKELKKLLKLIEPKKGSSACAVDEGDEIRAGKKPKLDCSTGGGGVGGEKAEMTEAEVDFVKLLEDELEKFNTFFVEKEEEYIIRLKELQDRVAKFKDYTDEMIKIRKEIVDFHGEMVLLENYSALNYTGLVKILKKYDKRTGALLRLPFIEKVLQQPFFTIDLLYKLVKECERMLDHLFLVTETPSATAERGYNNEVGSQIEDMESLYMRSSLSALRALKEIRSGSSTVSVFSLPPLQVGSGLDEPWNKVPIIEQVAK